MGYSTNDRMVRVDFFKDSGKWYATEALLWDRYETHKVKNLKVEVEAIHDTFKRCLRKQYPNRYRGMIALCLEPYHEYSHPLMIRI